VGKKNQKKKLDNGGDADGYRNITLIDADGYRNITLIDADGYRNITLILSIP